MQYLHHIKQYIPEIDIQDVCSTKKPLLWYFIVTLIFLGYILIGNHNEQVFFSIFNLAVNNNLLDAVMRFSAAYLFIVILLLALLWILVKQNGSYIRVGLSYIAVGIIAYILSKIGTHLIIDTRPYIAYHLTPLISVAKDNGFPSDHTMLSMAVASVISLYSKTMGWVLFILAFVVSFARVYVAAHHPLDVIGSMVIVAMALILFIGISKLAQKLI